MSVTIGEIRMYAGRYAPDGWLFCQGQQLPKVGNGPLYDVILETFGGDASTFNLPDMRGRVPLHQGNGFAFGRLGGSEMVTLAPDELPSHSHKVLASTAGGATSNPGGKVLATSASIDMYVQDAPTAQLAAASIAATFPDPNRQVQPHENRQPYAVTNFVIAAEPTAWDDFPGEVRVFAFDDYPDGWLRCGGNLAKMTEHLKLYSAIGQDYGGRGSGQDTWFGLPEFVNRVPVGTGLGPDQLGPDNDGQPYERGGHGGEVSVALVEAQIPSHDHRLLASTLAADIQRPATDRSLGRSTGAAAYVPGGTADAPMAPEAISHEQAEQWSPHENMMPTLGFNFCISDP
jgi:microcystin-dependent protein